jgi:hypothetical protein
MASEIGAIARVSEQLVMGSPRPEKADKLEEAVRRLEAVLTVARAQVAAGTSAPNTGLRAARRRHDGGEVAHAAMRALRMEKTERQ